MEIPQEVQDKLKCSECDELLSCGPVYLLHESGGAICGRCSDQSQETNPKERSSDRIRIEPYEAAASLLAFPCAHASRGCPETVPFSLGRPPHELSCKFRPLICPVAPRGSCDSITSWEKLKQHCEEKHPLNVFENPCNLPRPDLTTSNLQTYVISAFRFIFLLHVKVCVESGKLFHSLRMFGDQGLLDKVSYTLKIEGNDSKTVKKGSVLPPGIMMLQEPTANYILINSLLDFLGDKYDKSKFTITIHTSITFNCINCSKDLEKVFDSQFCNECQEKLDICRFNENGCLYVDFNYYKCKKHERFFCKYQMKCFSCKVEFNGGSLIEHLSSSNSCKETTKASINSVFRVTPYTALNRDYILLSSDNIGTIICKFDFYIPYFHIYLYTSLPSHELKKFICLIELTDPKTKHTEILTPQIEYKNNYDWCINKNMNNFPSCSDIGTNMKINIEKI